MTTDKPAKAKAVSSAIGKVKHFIENLWSELPDSAGRFQKFTKRFVQTLVAAGQKFMRDENFMRGTSIGYTLVVSFVPTIVVVLLVGARFINPKELFYVGKEFIRKNGIPIDPDPYIKIIEELLNNAGAITGIGFLIMLFSATSVLRNVEQSLNTVWRVDRKRPFVQKISGFLMVLLFGPALLTVGISTAQSLLNQFASPDLKTIKFMDDRVVILGDKKVILERNQTGRFKYSSIINKIEFEAQKDPIVVQADDNSLVTGAEKEQLGPKLVKTSKGKLKTSAFTDVARQKNLWWLVTNEGSLLSSPDDGKNWFVQRFMRKDGPLLYDLRFEKILMLENGNGMIIGSNGLILITRDRGNSWQPKFQSGISQDLTDLEVLNNGTILITGTGFTLLKGDLITGNFQQDEKFSQLTVKGKGDIHGITSGFGNIWVCGQAGTLIRSGDNGLSWNSIETGLTNHDFRSIAFRNRNEGVVVAEEGRARFTDDGGKTWKQAEIDTNVDLIDVEYEKGTDTFYILGNAYHIIANRKGKLHDFHVIQKSEFWRLLITALGNVFLPFIVIWLLFFLVYKIIPYTSVTAMAAAVGAAATSILWVVFLLSFKFYVSLFAKGTFAIYGTLAAIPLFLLLVYVSTLIMLFGAEVSFYVQNPSLLRLNKKQKLKESEKTQIWYGIRMLHQIFYDFETGKGPTAEEKLVKICNSDATEMSRILDKFSSRGYIQRTEAETWVAIKSPRLIKMNEVIEDLDPADYEIPDYSEKNLFMKETRKYFEALTKEKQTLFGKITFADLLDKAL